ncbi:Tigger transposable element-derived protein 4 [Araneus ventricosus]|uniref:Tigger transposable element-derived protein 4 n=1 Tax=Araneus ventricosus TaxID=182803 RepID=A0A4Y2LD60_ARAVE|nr:Tigger transposable element-derived protein 4 [Araneus ventricosus]
MKMKEKKKMMTPIVSGTNEAKDEKIEIALKLWFSNVRERDSPIRGPLIRQKAEDLAAKTGQKEFVAADGWFHRWNHGEQKSADVAAASQWIEKDWPKLIASYALKHVHNADESRLYYTDMPSHTFLFKGESTKGHKSFKGASNYSVLRQHDWREKKLLVIGRSKKPRCFKRIKKLPVDYFANNSAWMTSVIFNNWLLK